MGVWYTTRESVKQALDIKLTARSDAQVDEAIEAASRAIEGVLHRKFYPLTATKYFDWPNDQYAYPWRLWFDEDEVISISLLVSGGTTIAAVDYNLEPRNQGPPFYSVEIDLSSNASFGGGSTHQQSIAITGEFGYRADTAPAGALAEALDGTETDVDVTNSAVVGVGDVIKVDNERMIVTGKDFLDTGQNLVTGLATGQANDVVATCASNATLFVGETLLLADQGERVLLVDKSGATTFTVKRQWDGTILATHTTTDIFAPRTLTVERGALGTTAATHSNGAAITKHVAPGQIRTLCKAESINTLQQESAAWGRVVGSGDNEKEMAGRGLASAWAAAEAAYGRARIGAI